MDVDPSLFDVPPSAGTSMDVDEGKEPIVYSQCAYLLRL